MPSIVKPASLNPGDTIGIMAPGSSIDPEAFKFGCFTFESAGYQVVPDEQCYKKHHQSAGTAKDKAEALEELYLNDQINAIILASGGNRTLHFLDLIDFNVISHNPKIIMGYSDCTALLGAIQAHTGQCVIHGPTITWFGKDNISDKAGQLDKVLACLQGDLTDMDMSQATSICSGEAQGPLIGGNLSLIMHMIFTRWCPDLKGAILYLEDTGDELSWLDRDFWYLKETGILQEISGLVLGGFSLGDSGRPFGFTLEDILKEHMADLDIPIVTNAPFGHNDVLHPLPFGAHGVLKASGEHVSLEFESPVSK